MLSIICDLVQEWKVKLKFGLFLVYFIYLGIAYVVGRCVQMALSVNVRHVGFQPKAESVFLIWSVPDLIKLEIYMGRCVGESFCKFFCLMFMFG